MTSSNLHLCIEYGRMFVLLLKDVRAEFNSQLTKDEKKVV